MSTNSWHLPGSAAPAAEDQLVDPMGTISGASPNSEMTSMSVGIALLLLCKAERSLEDLLRDRSGVQAGDEQSFAKTPHPAYSLDSREPLSWQVSRDNRSPSQSKLEDWIGVNQDRMVERSVSPRPSRGFRSVGAVRQATPLPVVWSRSAPAQSAISPSSAPPGAYRRLPTRVPRRSGLEAP